MQLSRGEGVFHWEIAPVDEDDVAAGYGLGIYGYGHAGRFGGDWEEAQMEMEMEMQRVRDGREMREWVEGDVLRSNGNGKEEECERKDSKGVSEEDEAGIPMHYVFGEWKGKQRRVDSEGEGEWVIAEVEIGRRRFMDEDEGPVYIEKVEVEMGREAVMDVDGDGDDDGPVYIEDVRKGR